MLGFDRGLRAGAALRGKATAMKTAAAAHKGRTAAGVVTGLGVAGYVSGGRRGRGVDKMRGGRPTGMYGY